MRFNAKELAAVALQPSHKFDKEGILFIREKQDGLFRRGEVFVPRFCRLRGNMLFYFKNTHQCSEPAGVFVLEHCVVQLDDSNADGNYGFTLQFEGDKTAQHLATAVESERDTWIQALHMASYEYMRSQLQALQEKLNALKREDDVVVDSRLTRAKSLGDSADEPFLEMSFACDNLVCDGDGTPPNPMLIISIIIPPESHWQHYMQTEILDRCSNPCFLTTVGLRSSTLIKSSTRIKISAHDVRERLTSTMTLIGTAEFTIADIMEAEKNKLRLILLSAENITVGFVSVTAWQVEPDTSNNASGASSIPSPQDEQVFASTSSQTCPIRLSSKPRTAQLNQLGMLYDNIVSQTYRFHSGLGADLSVHEIMAENKIAFKLPQALLALYIKEEKEYLSCLTSFGEVSPNWTKKQIEEIERHLQLINSYTQALTNLDAYDGPNFKASTRKAESGLEFVPVNLHLQRMWVQNDSTKKNGFYDVLTVGAFTAHSMKFKNGGLLRLMSASKCNVNNNNLKKNKKNEDKFVDAAEAAWKIKNLQQDLRNAVDQLNTFASQCAVEEMQPVMSDIKNMANQVVQLCEPILMEDASQFLEDIRSTRSGSPYNGHVIQRRTLPLPASSASNSPLPSHRSRASSIEKDIQISLPPSPDEKTDISKDWPLRKFQHRRSSSDAHLYNEPSSELNERQSLFNLKISEEESRTKPIKPEPFFSPNLSRKRIWKLQRNHSAREDTRSSVTSLGGVAENNNAPTGFLNRSISKLRHERSLINMNYCDNSTEGNKPEEMSLQKSRKSSSLRSLDSSRIRSRSPDEPEPLESSEVAAQKCLIRFRRDIVFSQALTAAVAGIMTRFWCIRHEPLFLSRIREIGLLLEFEGLLSCYGDEMGMLEDMVTAINDLSRVTFKFHRYENNSILNPTVEGHRMALVVSLPVPDEVFASSEEGQRNFSFSVIPVFFNIGINEQATFAVKKTSCMHSVSKYTRFGDNSLQEKINVDGCEQLAKFYEKYQQIPSVKERYQRTSLPLQTKSVDSLLDHLATLVRLPKSKNVEILHAAAEICRLLGGIRFTSCKSAKDRTSMAVTLEQCLILQKEFELAEPEFQHVLDCMRCEGTRRENTLKNAGVKKYAFNSLQLMALPKLYRPPPGTYGNVQT